MLFVKLFQEGKHYLPQGNPYSKKVSNMAYIALAFHKYYKSLHSEYLLF